MKNQSIKQVVAIGVWSCALCCHRDDQYSNACSKYKHPASVCGTEPLVYYFGPLVGLLVGLIGHAVKDSLAGYGLWWTWIIASGLFGLAVGLFRKYIRVTQGVFELKDIVFFNLIQIVANALVWGVLAPLGDVVIYQEAAEKVFAQGIVAGIANAVTVAIAGTLLLLAYSRTQTRSGSLKKD